MSYMPQQPPTTTPAQVPGAGAGAGAGGKELLGAPRLEGLPIDLYQKEIERIILDNPTSVIIGETGSGKTTRIPIMLYNMMKDPNSGLPTGKIAVTQPRRPAATGVAAHVALENGVTLGKEIGYQISGENFTSPETMVNFMTDGIMLEMLKHDPLLEEYSVVMVDEAHERSLNIDFTLGLLKRAQALRKEKGLNPLKVIVTSATIEKEKFQNYFGDWGGENFKEAPSLVVPGRLYDIDLHYQQTETKDHCSAAAEVSKSIVQAMRDGTKVDGDILIFMPGEAEIKQTIENLNIVLGESLDDVEIFGLMGSTDGKEQKKILEKRTPGGKRRIIVSTNVAETSVTVPDVRYVIDSGLINQTEYDPMTGIEALVTKKHAQAGCNQRKGRAGRTAAGECYRLYTEDDFNKREAFQKPEIQRANLGHVVLMMKKMGIKDIRNFDFIEPPEAANMEAAFTALKKLGALTEDEELTENGRFMAELPLSPELSRMIVEAHEHDCVLEIITVAALLRGKPIFRKIPTDEDIERNYKTDKEKAEARARAEADALAQEPFKKTRSDVFALLEVWREYQKHNFNYKWANSNGLNARNLEEAKSTQEQLLGVVKNKRLKGGPIALKLIEMDDKKKDAVGKSVLAGYIGNLLQREGRLRNSNKFKYSKIVDGTEEIIIHGGSALAAIEHELVVSLSIFELQQKDKRPQKYSGINHPVKLEWIEEVAPQMVERRAPGFGSDGAYFGSK